MTQYCTLQVTAASQNVIPVQPDANDSFTSLYLHKYFCGVYSTGTTPRGEFLEGACDFSTRVSAATVKAH